MMNSAGGNCYFDVSRLCNEAVDRNFRGETNSVGSVTSQQTYALVWQTFVKWCYTQIESGRAINVPEFGTIGYQQVKENIRILYVRLSGNFLNNFNLSYKPEMADFESQNKNVSFEPLQKPNFASMSKLALLDTNTFKNTLINIFQVIGELLSENAIVEIDLGDFGKLFANNRQVLYDPLNKFKSQAPQGKQTVKALMDFGPQGGKTQPGFFNQYNTGQYQDQQQINQMQGQLAQPRPSSNAAIGRDIPQRRYKKPFGDGKITKDLLGAGDDPMAKNQDYSLLANNPTALMKNTFKKPGKANSRYPPVIDAFSRTLAAPISSERHYFSVCHKIGTNFSPSCKGFYIDTEARFIRFKQPNLGGTKLEISGQNSGQTLVEPADEQEEYEALIFPQNADKRRIQARKVSYARYRQYVENEISVDVIAPIRQYWLTHIIELIPGDLHAVEKERIEYLIDTMLNEINKDYFDSVRKSILDYILKNENEMRRLGIQQVLNQPIDWGDDYYKGIEPNEEWKHNVMMARMLMSENLCICSQATLELMKLWQDYKNYLFIEIPQPRSEPQELYHFITAQDGQMSKIKNLLCQDWNKSAVEILREELENLDKDQAKNFFESVATLMSNQVRELVEQSVDAYVKFIQRFKKGSYPKPDEIIQREYDADTPFEDSFITLKLTIDESEVKKTKPQIIFSTPLNTVQSELEKIVDLIVQQSSNLPRPENTIARSEKTHLWDVGIEDEIVGIAKTSISNTLSENLDVVATAVHVYDSYLWILTEKDRVKDFINQEKNYDRELFQEEIIKFQDTILKIRDEMPFEIRMNMFLIRCSDINNILCDECEDIMQLILEKVSNLVFQDWAADIIANVKQISDQTQHKSTNSAELVKHEKRIDEVKLMEQRRLMETYNELIEWLVMLNKNPKYKTPEDLFKSVQYAFKHVNMINGIIDKCENKLKQERIDIENALMDQTKRFIAKIDEQKAAINAFKERGNVKQTQAQQFLYTDIANINKEIKFLQEERDRINQQQTDLEMMPGEYGIIDDLKPQVKLYEELWELQIKYTGLIKTWNEGPVRSLDPLEVSKEHNQMLRTAIKLAARFENMTPKVLKPMSVATNIQKGLMDFIPYIPIIDALCNLGLKPRHEIEIKEAVGTNIDSETKLSVLKEMGIRDKREILDQISDTATREFNNENAMKKMKDDWEPVEFTCKQIAGKDSKILQGDAVEIIQTFLDDHIIKTQTMKGSPFARFMLDEITVWETLLMKTQDNLDLWLKVQAVWMYLEPVFSSEDIISQMPVEGQKFKEVNIAWHNLMVRIDSDPKAFTVIYIEDLGEILKKANEKLERVQKGLKDYLESKSALFPRFYFLSDEELLEILSETKEPLRVQPHLKKCFEGIHKLDFDDEKKIHGMKSIEGENVPYVKVIDPIASKGMVEDWLLQVEDVMLKSLKQQVEAAFADYSSGTLREKWIMKWPGQIVLCIAMTYWTSQTEDVMKKSGFTGLAQYFQKLSTQLLDTVSVVRSDINNLNRATVEALIVLDVHAKEVIQNELILNEVADTNDFKWLAQMRYYWEDNDIWVRIINSKLDYNYEYLGNSPRLVITALTDRCYRTLCGAVALNYGGAPEGPAGTGKTETVKDLAKALARQCIVFNCSDGLDYKIMGKFFKGLSSCGAWSCFDEFNRIELEVLSVIAQQLQCIQYAIDKKLERFIFEDCDIPLKKTCNCFITMNPGYAGRSELPDNLKALFRSVAMMVPDYAVIAEISLYSYGFEAAKPLALKITTTYSLCSEQLSSQDHYDYGMRAVKSVLTAAGNLKREYMDENESILMLRAINDVNLAKFLAHDLPLFKNITGDLFPGVVLPEPDYKDLLRCMNDQIAKRNLQQHPYFIMKVIQLYEMIRVRHGLMIVGMPFSGKSMCLRVLAGALTQLNAEGLNNECKVHISVINPKSITMGQLYGNHDPVSHDWTDGVLAVTFRTLSMNMDVENRRWMIFDGPVDALWIENMNTVLDDNKKLCLQSGEIIAMSQNMNMIFEPMDLAVASPATVSRCGMVYLQPHEMGWMHLFTSWKNTLPTKFGEDQLKVIDQLVNTIVQPTIDYITQKCKQTTPTEEQCLVVGLLRIWRALLKVFDDENHFNQFDKKQITAQIGSSFLFACIWSLCVCINTEYRKPFDLHFKKICDGSLEGIAKLKDKIIPPAFDRGTIYDYCYIPDTNEWKNWMDFTNKDEVDQFPKNAVPNEIIVTTVDTIRYGYILEMFIMNDIRPLFVGPTGTGKTCYIQNVLHQKLSEEKFLIIEIGFSAQTHCNQVQDIVDGKIDKRRRDHFGPRQGMRCVIFVDDLNMPKKEFYGAQPPIEILRQFIDAGGWYDRKDPKHPFRNILDSMLICSMGTPGGGKSFITPRFQRHFNIVAFANFDDSTMTTIFRSILKWYFRTGNFVTEVSCQEQKIVAATMKVYEQIQLDLRPTPMKTHYTFNLRDFSKVICGMCMCTKKELNQSDTTLRLWAHECVRIFGDRLINNVDRMWMLNCIKDCTRAPFGQNFDSMFKHLDTDKNGKVETLDEFRGLLFGDIYTPFGIPERPYEEIMDHERLVKCADDSLSNYNAMSDTPMPLVLFNFAIEHLLRIGRVLKQPGGHGLLVGVGGSGRQSLTKLGSRLADFDIFQIEIKKNYRMIEWREDIKELMRQVASKGNPTTFIFTDNQIKEEGFLEDINNILNTGEVPNIFPADEKTDALELVRGPAKQEDRCPNGSPQELFAYFLERCKACLHMIICFSPIGASLRNRIRDFPSIVNCTTIDWFSEWPPDALEAVAQRFLEEVEMEDEIRQHCVVMVQNFHTSTEVTKDKFYRVLKRIYYVTPTSYLELINTFKTLLKEKRTEISNQKNRYANGYAILILTEEKVGAMQKKLEDLQPILIQTGKETSAKLVIVSKETAAADEIKASVSVEEAEASKIATEANDIKVDCETQLAHALPALRAAEEAVKCITTGDIAILKKLASPPPDVKLVTSVVCMLFGKQPVSKMNTETQKKEKDYWPTSVLLMSDMKFLQNLLNFDKESMTQALIDSIQQYITLPNFTIEKLQKVSQVAMNLAKWVFAMDKFYNVNKIVVPKKEQLKIAEEKYAAVMKVLNVKQAELKVIVDKVNVLKADLKLTEDKKQDLEEQVADCEARLIKAKSLIGGLGGEKLRWRAESERLAIVYENLTGDILISSGMIAYLGAFTSVFRSELTEQWINLCEEKEIPNSGKFSLERVLGNAVQIRNWGLAGLPNDAFSIENAIINEKARRWPLFIDPQTQASKWIKSMFKEQGVKTLKFTDGNYLKFLEAGIRNGNPVLIENIGEEMDPAIEPLLQKQIVVKGKSMTLKLGDSVIDYSKDFRFLLCTKLTNPHYLPEVSTKVTLINFMITMEGLSDQLLGIVVEKENPDLQTKKEQLVIEGAQNKNKLQEIEDQILHTLQNSEDILGDAEGIQILENAKVVSDEISKKQEFAEKTEKEIDEARTGYKPVSGTSAGLFFCITDLANIDPMYQYSLDFFKGLFIQSILTSEKSDELEERLGFLNKEFLESLYRNICRSLFEKDKLIFSFLLTIKLMQMAGEILDDQFKFLLTGGVSLGEALPDNPAPEWMSEKNWGELTRMSKCSGFAGFIKHFEKNLDHYKAMYDSTTPHEISLPQSLSMYNHFQFLCVMRVVRSDKLMNAIADFVVTKLGIYFITPPDFDLGVVFKDSNSSIPLIFVLSPGADPLASLQKYAELKKKVVNAVSLGQGQGPKAIKFIDEGVKKGTWVVLQNCHLAVKWMGELEKQCEELPPRKPHRDFRLWLTSYPSGAFPVSVLQNGVKMTNEPPMGLKANLIGSFSTFPMCDKSWFEGNTQPKVFRKLLFSLCFFHAFIQERKLFGPLGWNIQYQFNENDLRISAMQLNIFIDEYPEKVPLDALNYLTGECNYGGRVTDTHDRTLMKVILKNFYNADVYGDPNYKYSPSGLYYPPAHTDYEGYIAYIKQLPNFPEPEIYGFHMNAAITKNQNATNLALETVLSTQSQSGGGTGGDSDALINRLANSILAEVPKPFDQIAAEQKYPISYTQSMNTVLTQELTRFNGLIRIIIGSLNDLKKAIKGEVLLSTELEAALGSLENGIVPAMWLKKSFPSLKPLGSYIKDMMTRLNWFQLWLDTGLPPVLFITRFFFTHGFLTANKQNYARKYGIAIDLLSYDFEVPEDQEQDTQPDDGMLVTGMYLEGCRWDMNDWVLVDSDPKILYTKCPLFWFKPIKTVDIPVTKSYMAPIYKTSIRKGVLATTGHSTNFVLLLKFPTSADPEYWTLRGVAALCALDD